MGFPPPPDAPSVAEQDAISADASFEPAPSGIEICGFPIPFFSFNLSFFLQLPDFGFPPTLPFPMISLKCDLSDPIDVSFGPGGGRVPSADPNVDDEFG